MADFLDQASLPDDHPLLADLQCNTLSPHRRNLAVHLFFRLGPDPERNLDYVKGWAERANSLRQQADDETARAEAKARYVAQALADRSPTTKIIDWLSARRVFGRRWARGSKTCGDALAAFRAVAPRGLIKSVMLSGRAFTKLPPWAGQAQKEGLPSIDPAWVQGMAVQEYSPGLFANPGKFSTPEEAQVAVTQGWVYPWNCRRSAGEADDGKWPASRYENRVDVHVMLAEDADLDASEVPWQPSRAMRAEIAREIDFVTGIGGEAVHQEWSYLCPHPRGGYQEHFGFRDGIANVHFLDGDIARARQQLGSRSFGTTLRNALFELKHRDGQTTYGSHFVFRPIKEKIPGDGASPLSDPVRTALTAAIGRNADGEPLVTPATKGLIDDFDYGRGSDTARCPFHAHIRKANPRGSSKEKEAGALFPRRGMLFGARAYEPVGKTLGLIPTQKPSADQPERPVDVGLIFMAYMGSIERQFGRMQREWLNAKDFPGDDSKIDPVVGQDAPSVAGDYTQVLGGEHFFVPSLSWLRDPRPRIH